MFLVGILLGWPVGLFLGLFTTLPVGWIIGFIVRTLRIKKESGDAFYPDDLSDSDEDENEDEDFSDNSDSFGGGYICGGIQNLTYLLDGSNLLRQEEESHGISLDVICSITDYLKNIGANYYVLFDANAPHIVKEYNSADLARFYSLLKNDSSHFRLVPGGTIADIPLLEEARRNPNAIILTNDRYRDHFNEYPDVLNDSERRLQPMQFMMDGSIWFSRINLSIPLKRGSWNRFRKT